MKIYTIHFLTPQEVANRWKCDERTIRRYCSDHKLKAHFIAGHWRISRYALEEYEEQVCNIKNNIQLIKGEKR